MNEIKVKLKFKNYEFRRVKTMGGAVVLYTNKEWIGKEVCIIPVPMTVTDRLIESTYDEQTHRYNFETHTNMIYQKTVKSSGQVGRIYVHKDLIGLDCLIIEAPTLEDF